MFDSQIFLTVCSFLLGMFVGIRISAPLDDAIHEINTEPKDNGLLGRLIVENTSTDPIFFSTKNWEPWEPEPKPEQQDNGLLGRLIVENARLRVRLDAIELPHATYKYVCTHCSHTFNIGRNQEVCICPACGGSSED